MCPRPHLSRPIALSFRDKSEQEIVLFLRLESRFLTLVMTPPGILKHKSSFSLHSGQFISPFLLERFFFHYFAKGDKFIFLPPICAHSPNLNGISCWFLKISVAALGLIASHVLHRLDQIGFFLFWSHLKLSASPARSESYFEQRILSF